MLATQREGNYQVESVEDGGGDGAEVEVEHDSSSLSSLFLGFITKETGLLLAVARFLSTDMIGRMIFTCKEIRMIIEAPKHDYFWEHICKTVFQPPSYRLANALPANRSSWRSIFLNRPYAKLDGFYVQKYMYIRPRQAPSMWDEVPAGHVLYVHHYRYIAFTNRNGQVLYACSAVPPHKFGRDFHPGNRHVRVGQYAVRQNKIQIDLGLTENETLDVVLQTSVNGWRLTTKKHEILRTSTDVFQQVRQLPSLIVEKPGQHWNFHRVL